MRLGVGKRLIADIQKEKFTLVPFFCMIIKKEAAVPIGCGASTALDLKLHSGAMKRSEAGKPALERLQFFKRPPQPLQPWALKEVL